MQQQDDQSTEVLSKLNRATGYQFSKSEDRYTATINLYSARALQKALNPYVVVSLNSDEGANKRLAQRDKRATLSIEAEALETPGTIDKIMENKDKIYWDVCDQVATATSAHRPGCEMGR